MMTGHSYSRALRAHFLTQQALGTILLHSAELDATLKEQLQLLHTRFLEDHNMTEADRCSR